MRTPNSCGICGVMGHTRRTCRIIRLRREGESMGAPLTREEEQRVRADLLREFNETPLGIRWNTYHREVTERRERARQERETARQEIERRRNLIRERLLEEQRQSRTQSISEENRILNIIQSSQAPGIDIIHSFTQIQSWARRAEREVRTSLVNAAKLNEAKSLSLKMVSGFKEEYVVNDECAICYDRKPTVGLPCKHTFCGECTVIFAKRAQNCPLCRASFQEVHFSHTIEPDVFNKLLAKLSL